MKSIKGRMAIAAAAMAAATAHALQVNNPFPDRWVWVTTYNDNKRQIQSGCVDPGKARDFQRDGSSEGIKVRVEVMTAPGCKGDKTCDTDMSFGRFEVRDVYIHRNHQVQNRCYLSESATPTEIPRLHVTNTYMNRHVWITTYESGPARSKIQSGCVSPKQKTDFVNENYGRYFFVRAEVMTDPSCKGQKTCDTDILVNSREMGTNIVIHANARDANRCYLDTK